jgi:tetratricopeptide (TPR) repeat protein
MGGNLVACPVDSDSAYYNPAGWGLMEGAVVSARYESLFTGLEGDTLADSGLGAGLPLGAWGGAGFFWEHFGANLLQQNRFNFGWGRNLASKQFNAGFDFSLLHQAVLSSSGQVSAQAFSLGGGLLYSPIPCLSLGAATEDVNQPNLGILGPDRLGPAWRWGLAWRGDGAGIKGLSLTLAQAYSDSILETQGGVEWVFAPWGTALRAGADANSLALGFGWQGPWLSLDYAYNFSLGSMAAEGLPGSHLLELSLRWGRAKTADPVDNLMRYARDAAARQDWRAAFWYGRQACALRPKDALLAREKDEALRKYNLQRAAGYFGQGIQGEKQGLLIEAKRYYEWAVALDPGNSQYPAAGALLAERIHSQMTSNAPPLNQGALADAKVVALVKESAGLAERGKLKPARDSMRRALALYPRDKILGYFMAILESGSKVARDPQVERLISEAEIYEKKGRQDLARQAWKEVLQRQPDHALAINKVSGADAVRPSLSAADAARAEELYENGLKAYLNGDTPKAVELWEAVLKIDPGHVNALNNLARARLEMKEVKP